MERGHGSARGMVVVMATAQALCSSLPARARGPCRQRQAQALQRRWLEQLTWGPQPLQAVQIQQWLALFPVDWRQLPDPGLLERQIASIRQHLSGSYTALLSAMLLDPALQLSLNGPANQRRSPNENLARELLELFSLGADQVQEADVREAARALSGYRLDGRQQLQLDPRRHDPGPHTILGRSAAFDAPSLAAWLCEQPATARSISARLWRQRVCTSPSTARLEALAAGWRQQQLSLPWLQAAIDQAPEAVASRQQGLRLADPLEMVVRSLRLLGSRHGDALAISLRRRP